MSFHHYDKLISQDYSRHLIYNLYVYEFMPWEMHRKNCHMNSHNSESCLFFLNMFNVVTFTLHCNLANTFVQNDLQIRRYSAIQLEKAMSTRRAS